MDHKKKNKKKKRKGKGKEGNFLSTLLCIKPVLWPDSLKKSKQMEEVIFPLGSNAFIKNIGGENNDINHLISAFVLSLADVFCPFGFFCHTEMIQVCEQ